MPEIIRDGALGQLVRLITKNKFLQYPEEREDFSPPGHYEGSSASTTYDRTTSTPATLVADTNPTASYLSIEEKEEGEVESPPAIPAAVHTRDVDQTLNQVTSKLEEVANPDNEDLYQARTQRDLEGLTEEAAQPVGSKLIRPETLKDGTVLVTWYTEDDSANPQNWSSAKKVFVTAVIMLYTTAVYMGGSIYAPAEGAVVTALGVSLPVASLGLALYVVGYGVGPLIWSPLSEIPVIGRNPIYIITMALFVLFSLGAALVNNIGGLLILRFLQGFWGSPALATGGATLQDIWSLNALPYVISMWACAACVGPAIGPMISGFSVTAENWHWALWEILWLAGPTFIVMFVALPETNAGTILLQRARRLRSHNTTTQKLAAQSEFDQGSLTFAAVAKEALIKPFELNFLDPSIAFTSIYTGLLYSLFYSFFEAFPLIFVDIYHFNLGLLGVAFLSCAVGFALGVILYCSWVYFYVNPRIVKYGFGSQEERLLPALLFSMFMPIGMFITGWTAREDIHWIVPMIGVAIVTIGVFIVFQCLFLYLPLTYPSYAASLFAGNDLARSLMAAGAIMYSTPLYKNLGIGPASSLLGSLMAACVVGVWILWYYGDKLRARSKFSAK